MNISEEESAAMKNMKSFVKMISLPGMIFLMGILLRIVYLHTFSSLPLADIAAGADVSEYYGEAVRILHGEWGIDPHGIHGISYPYILALFLYAGQGSLLTARALQGCIFLLGVLVPLYGILKKSLASCSDTKLRYLPEISCLIAAVYPPLIIYQCDLFSENLMIILFLFSLWSLCGKMYLHKGLSGILCGAALTAHAGGIFFPVLGTLYVFFGEKEKGRKKQFLYSCAFLLGVLLVIAPISIYKSVRTSGFVLLQKNSMFNAFLGNNPSATGTCYLSPGVRWDAEADQAEAVCEREGISKDSYYRNRILHFIFDSPIQFFGNLLKKACMAISAREFTTWSDITSLKLNFFHKWGYHGWFLVLLMLGGPFLVSSLFKKERRDLLKPFLLLFAAGFCSQTFFLTSGRYRLILIFPLMVCAAAFFCAWYEDLKYTHSGIPYFALLFILFGISVYPYKISMQPERDYARTLLADGYLRSGQMPKAISLLKDSTGNSAFPERCLTMMGSAFMSLKDFREAERCFTECVKRFPNQAEHWMNLGNLYSQTNRLQQALRCMDEAEKRKMPPDLRADLAYNRGRILQQGRLLPQAEQCYKKALEFDPFHRKALNNLGTVYLMKRPPMIREAQTCFRKALLLEKGNLSLQVNLALTCAMLGEKDPAQKILKEVLKADPRNTRALQLKKALDRE